MHAGTTRAAQSWAVTFVTKSRANPTDSLTDTFIKGNALLH